MSQAKARTAEASLAPGWLVKSLAVLAISGFAHAAVAAESPTPAPPEAVVQSEAALDSQKLLKTLKTPFGATKTEQAAAVVEDNLSSFTLSLPATSTNRRRSLAERLVPPQLCLPGHMTIGKTVEFTVKGKPGMYVALAKSDKNTGAKPIQGHTLRLGPDRKVVGAVEMPPSGVAVISVDTPIEGDLVGQCLYFEAALWSKSDMSDLEIASVVPSEAPESVNGVPIVGQLTEKKKGIKIVPDGAAPILTRQHAGTAGLDSGKP